MPTTKAWTAVIMALWIGVAVATIVMTALVSYSGAANAPFADEWYFTNPETYLNALFTKHHGHPFVFGRLGMAFDYYVFDARGWALRAFTFVLSGLGVCAILVIGRLAGLRSLLSQIVFGAFAIVAIFNAQAADNFIWGFQFAFVLAFVASAGAIAALSAYAAQAAPWKLGLAIALSVVATLSLANGVLTPLILLLMTWRLHLPRRILIIFAGLTALSWIAYLVMPNDIGGPSALRLQELPTMLLFGVQLIGSAPGGVLAYLHHFGSPPFAPLTYSLVCGLIGLALALALGGVAAFKEAVNPGRIGAAGLIAFALGTLALVAIARPQLSTDFHLWSRYTLASGLLFVGIAALAASAFERWSKAARYAALTVAALAAMTIPVAAASVAVHMAQDQNVRIGSYAGLIAGVTAARSSERGDARAYARAQMLERNAADLEAHGKWLFQDQWSRAVGRQIDTRYARARVCSGGVFRLRNRSTIERGFVVVRGNLDANETRAGRIVVVVDEHRVVTGYGLVGRQARDVFLLFGSQPWQSDWIGFANVAADQLGSRYTAYLASPDQLLCRLGRPALITVTPVRRVRPTPAPR